MEDIRRDKQARDGKGSGSKKTNRMVSEEKGKTQTEQGRWRDVEGLGKAGKG